MRLHELIEGGGEVEGLRVTVIVPSYRRPDMLLQCLEGLSRQTRPADEIVVVLKQGDEGTVSALRGGAWPVLQVQTDKPGMVASLRAGVGRSTGEVLAFTDDDAVPRPGWLATLLGHYDDATVGGVGGRDVLHPPTADPERPATEVGLFTRWGRHLGNHHVGVGDPAEVQVLKGVNASYRRGALAMPAGLRGVGAEVHNEIAISTWARRHGWRLIYDPNAVVDHYRGPRFDSDQRDRPAKDAVSNEAYNLVFALLSLAPTVTARRAVFGLSVGDRATPGLLRAAAAVVRQEPHIARRLGPSLSGQLAALRDLARGRRVEMLTAEQLRSLAGR